MCCISMLFEKQTNMRMQCMEMANNPRTQYVQGKDVSHSAL
jgi:hypothetical protein